MNYGINPSPNFCKIYNISQEACPEEYPSWYTTQKHTIVSPNMGCCTISLTHPQPPPGKQLKPQHHNR